MSSAALLAGLQLYRSNEDLVKKWGSEISEKLSSKDPFVQSHALMLLGDTKRKDPQAYRKTLFGLVRSGFSGLAGVQLLRMLGETSRDI